MKLGKIFICINLLVLSLLMLTGCTEKWPRIIYQNTDQHNRTIVLDDGGHSYDIVETENGYDIIFHFISFAIGEKYIEIGRVTYAVAI